MLLLLRWVTICCLSQPGILAVRLYWWLGLVGGCGDFGISVDEGEDVVGDGEVVGLCLLGDVVFDVWGEFEGEGGGLGCLFGGSAAHGWEFSGYGLCLMSTVGMVLV